MKPRWSIFLLVLLLFAFEVHAAEKWNPQAAAEATVVCGNARFTVLTSGLVRMEWSEDGRFEDRASLSVVNRRLPIPKFKVRYRGGRLEISTSHLTLNYLKGGEFDSLHLWCDIKSANRKIRWRAGMCDTLNLRGTVRTLDSSDGETRRFWNPKYNHPLELEPGLLSRSGWTLIDESARPLFDGDSDWNWAVARPAAGCRDWYLFAYDSDYRSVLADFTAIAGKIPLPPRYAFGYWWSRYWQYSEDELLALLTEIEEFSIPIDVLVIDMDWHKTYGLYTHSRQDEVGENIGWTGYTWNRTLFPNPEGLLKELHRHGVQVALNLHPASGIIAEEESYCRFAQAYGWDTTGRRTVPFRIEDKRWAKCYFEQVLRPLERQGVDFWWLDWQQWSDTKGVTGLNNTFWLNYTFFSDAERKGGQRPLIFHRWGGLGNHRYQMGFSGDSWSTWKSLAYQPEFTATAANVGYGYWSHDIGGHIYLPETPDKEELYLRWIQFGVFTPVLRTHSNCDPRSERRIWHYPDSFAAMRDALKLRYALAPYIYNAARAAYDTGVSICHPLYYDYPTADEAYRHLRQYKFGDDMIAMSIATPVDKATGLATKTIWLPEGEWFEPSTGSLLKGGKVVERSFTTREIPYYVRGGAIIPMNPSSVKNLQQRCDTLRLSFTPGGAPLQNLEYYEDDGRSNDYDLNFARTPIVRERSENRIRVVIAPRQGDYAGASACRAYQLEFPVSWPAKKITVNGKEVAYARNPVTPNVWSYDGRSLTMTLYTESLSCRQAVEVEIVYEPGLDFDLLNGCAGQFSRIAALTAEMRSRFGNYITDEVYGVLYTGATITEHPEFVVEQLTRFRESLPRALDSLMEYPKMKQEEAFRKKLQIQLSR